MKFIIIFYLFSINKAISRRLDGYNNVDVFNYEYTANECPNDWIEKNNRCFYISKYASEWNQAREWCNYHSAKLVSFDDDASFDDVLDLLPKEDNLYFWVKFLFHFREEI